MDKKKKWNGEELFVDSNGRLIFYVQRVNIVDQIIADFKTGVCETVPCQDYNLATAKDLALQLKEVKILSDMTNKEIKSESEKMYVQIKSAEERLRELRAICKHEKTYEGNYSWRPGNIQLADICEYCGELIRYK